MVLGQICSLVSVVNCFTSVSIPRPIDRRMTSTFFSPVALLAASMRLVSSASVERLGMETIGGTFIPVRVFSVLKIQIKQILFCSCNGRGENLPDVIDKFHSFVYVEINALVMVVGCNHIFGWFGWFVGVG